MKKDHEYFFLSLSSDKSILINGSIFSPLWDINLGVWTEEAINNGYRSRFTEEFAILGFVEQGWITGLGGGEYGSVGMVVNCPIVFRFL
jgi:hypothetical protein